MRRLLLFAGFSLVSAFAYSSNAPVKIIFDTDMLTDFDDVGALACLHALADAGECEILATVSSTRGNASVGAVEVINGYYGRPDLPVGAPKGMGVLGSHPGAKEKVDPASPLGEKSGGDGGHYKYRKLVADYPKWVKHADADTAPDANETYRRVLAAQPDGSVTICTVGFLTNMRRLLETKPDDISPLDGRALVAKKVKLWVAMACRYPDGKEYNSACDAESSRIAIESWPTPIVFSDWQYGCDCFAGRALAEAKGPRNPVKDVFAGNIPSRDEIRKNPHKWLVGCFGMDGRAAWDETAVLVAVRGIERYFNAERGMYRMVGNDGDDEWVPDAKNGPHKRIVEKLSKAEVGRVIDELMMREPKGKLKNAAKPLQAFSMDASAWVAFDDTVAATVSCPDPAAAKWVKDRFAEWYGDHAPKVVAGKLSALDSRLSTSPEAYAASADDSGVSISANTLAGVRWATYTLRQLAIARRGTMKTEGMLLPKLKISDAPHLAFRAVHLCWFPEVRPQQIERAIRLAALLKFNYAIIEPWGMYKSERHPWWSWPQANMTKAEVSRLVAIGRDLGITLIPQVNCYGHASSSRSCTLKHCVLDIRPEYEPLFEPGGWNWCLSNPETQRVLRELIAEMHENFGNPPFFHLGCDEAAAQTCPECVKTPNHELVVRHIAGLAEFVKSRGAQAMIWHDMFLEKSDPRWNSFVRNGGEKATEMLDALPKDIVICDWQYSYGNMQEAREDWPTIGYFKDKGFPVAGCPWMNYKAMKPMADYLVAKGCFGFIETTWHHLRGGDWERMYMNAADAAWGSSVSHGVTFERLLRLVGHDMKTTDYLDTGYLNTQVPPGWWVDNN